MRNQITLTKPKSIYTILSEITGYPYSTCYAILKGQRSAKSKAGQKIMKSYEAIKEDYQLCNN